MMSLVNPKVFSTKKIITGIGCCFLISGLSGCSGGGEVVDLQQYIASVKAIPKETIQPLPEMKIVEPFIFNPEGLRNPFLPVEKLDEEESVDVASDTGVLPNTTRRKEELEAYPLDTLKMVGTVTQGDGLWGLIRASDGTIHRVQKGNYMGRNYGEIMRILIDKVELMEIVQEKPGSWHEKQASLALAE